MSKARLVLKTGDVARQAGVSVNTVRAYVCAGLLACEWTNSGQRHFDADAVARLKRISQLRELGKSLDEIKSLLSDSDLISPDVQRRREILKRRLASIREQQLCLRDEERQILLHLEMLHVPDQDSRLL